MPPPRPRGVGYNTGSTTSRPSPNTPMSERQQMALLIQMTANSTTEPSRAHIKKNEHKKCDDPEDVNATEKHDNAQETSRDKLSSTEEANLENKSGEHYNIGNADTTPSSSQTKRAFSDVEDDEFDDCDDVNKKKKRKESDSNKESKTIPNLRLPARTEKGVKQTSLAKSSPTSSKAAGGGGGGGSGSGGGGGGGVGSAVEKEQPESVVAKTTGFTKTFETDADDDENKMSDSIYSGGLKVPPLKIVIPQQNCSIDTDGNVSRTGKINTSRNAALPYVVSSNNNDSNERDAQCSSPHESPHKINTICNVIDEKNMKLLNEEKNLHRVLRSSHRSGITSAERSSNNSSPQMQSSSPSPASSHANEATDGKISFTNITASPLQQSQAYEHENIVNLPSPSTSSTSSSKDVHSNSVELHPRKRKIRSKNDDSHTKSNTAASHGTNIEASSSSITDAHTHDYPFTNCFQMFLNIRRQNEKKRRNMEQIKPRPPQGYNEYLLNKRTYLLAKNDKKSEIDVPDTVPAKMRDIFVLQEKERHELYQRHIVEREKLCLNVEQEIIRVHTKLARNSSCQSVPYSVCTMLKDEEVYNIATPEQEEKDKTARNRSNGRLLLGWLQDVDDKWDKIKEAMVLRHHNEAESLHAVQMMDWEIALKKYNLCDYKATTSVGKDHVPIVHVSDDFDLLPA